MMHNAKTAEETLEFLWTNYLTLREQVDLEAMPPEKLHVEIQQYAKMRPFRFSTWLARQGYYITAWNLWEYYSRNLCRGLPTKNLSKQGGATVDWVADTLKANSMRFSDHDWFASASCVRNLIAHHGARIDGPRAENLFERAQKAFPDLTRWGDEYILLEFEHTEQLHSKIKTFIRESE